MNKLYAFGRNVLVICLVALLDAACVVPEGTYYTNPNYNGGYYYNNGFNYNYGYNRNIVAYNQSVFTPLVYGSAYRYNNYPYSSYRYNNSGFYSPYRGVHYTAYRGVNYSPYHTTVYRGYNGFRAR